VDSNLSESQVGEAGPPDIPKREEEEEEWLLLGGELMREEGHRSPASSCHTLEPLQTQFSFLIDLRLLDRERSLYDLLKGHCHKMLGDL